MVNPNRCFPLGCLVLSGALLPLMAQVKPLTDAQIKERLGRLTHGGENTTGIVVGLIDGQGQRVFTEGKCEDGGSKPVDGDTLFEIGSITKAFTAIVLQDMADRGELKLDDPIAQFVPAAVKPPTRNGKEITLLDLATQSSGLPRLPGNLSPLKLVSSNPYSDYGPEQLYQFLSGYRLTRDIGSKYEYSNLGVGLLGHILALKAGTNYEALVIERICNPLKMASTRITLTPDLRSRLAPGHNAAGKTVENWDFQALAGAGALRSCMNDMMNFLSANMGRIKSPLTEVMAKTQEPRRDADFGRRIGLAWHLNRDGVVWHNGGTGGYRSFLGFNRRAGRGVIVLANSLADTDALGFAILSQAKNHVPLKVDPAIFDGYSGTYKLAPGAVFTVSRDGDHFYAQLTGQSKIEFYPESETDFFTEVVDARMTFMKDGSGKTTHLILHQNGADQTAPKEN
jgi:serine-type D-Ala-D-Ala carboxypeptidase/endopeptidase